jgi:O-antigen/teichoic acid export membrane protein
MWQLDRRLGSVIPAGSRRYEVRRWFAAAVPMVLVWGCYTLLTSTDVLVLKYFRPAEEVAHYFAAAKVVGIAGMVYFAVAASAAHRFTAYHVAGDSKGLATFSMSTVRWVFWLSLFISVTILALGRPLLSLFGDDFVSAYPVMAILTLGVLARASVGPAERLLMMLGYHRACLCAYLAALGSNLAGCLLLAPAWGAIGVALATVGGFVVESALLFAIAKRGPGLHMFVLHPRRK